MPFREPGVKMELSITPIKLLTLFACCILLLHKATSQQNEDGDLVDGSGEQVEGSGETNLLLQQTLPLNKGCLPLLDVALLFDSSGSMKALYNKQKDTALRIVHKLPVVKHLVRVSAIQYAGVPQTEFALNTYRVMRDVEEHLKGMRFRSGVTRTGKALKRARFELLALERGGRPEARKLIILFTDGVSLDNPLEIAAQLRKEIFTIFVISISNNPFEPELLGIAGDESRIFRETDISLLLNKVAAEVEKSRKCLSVEEKTKVSKETLALLKQVQEPKEQIVQKPTTATLAPNVPRIRKLTTISKELTTPGESKTTKTFTITTSKSDKITQSDSTTASAIKSTESATDKYDNATNYVVTTVETTGRLAENTTATINVTLTTVLSSPATAVPATDRPVVQKQRDACPVVNEKGELMFNMDWCYDNKPSHIKYEPEEPMAQTQNEINDFSDLSIVDDLKRDPNNPFPELDSLETDENERFSVLRADEIALNFGQNDVLKIDDFNEGISTLDRDRDCSADFLILLDSSGSVYNEYEGQKSFVRSLVEEIDINDLRHRVALMQFAGSHVQKLEFPFGAHRSKIGLERALTTLRHITGTTYMGAALKNAKTILQSEHRRASRTVVILISDGYSQDDAVGPAAQLRRVPGVQLYAVALATPYYRRYMEQLTGSPQTVFIGQLEAQILKVLIRSHSYCQ